MKMKRVVKLFHTVIGGVILTSLIYDGVFQNNEVFKFVGSNGRVLYAGTISQNKEQTKGHSLFAGHFYEPEGGAMTLEQKGESVTGTLTMDDTIIMVKGTAKGQILTGTLTGDGETMPFRATIDDTGETFTLTLSDETATFVRKSTPGKAAGLSTDPSAKLAKHALRFNGTQLDSKELVVIETLERQWGMRLPDGDYWYDPICGCAGQWGGPTAGFLPPGLKLGGPLRANCSGGGTKVFLNGREIHPTEYRYLSQLVGSMILPGRYWIDARGNTGLEGQTALTNLFVLAQQRANSGQDGGSWMRSLPDGLGGNIYMGGDGNDTYYQSSR